MAKIKKRKERVKLNEVLNRHLDEMEDSSSLDVFTPKRDANLEMAEMVNKALIEEKGGKRKGDNDSSLSTGAVVAIVIGILLFFFFVILIWNFIT